MAIRTVVLGLVAVSALALAAGCSAEVPADEDVQVAVAESPVEEKGMPSSGPLCLSTTPATYAQASKLAQFAFGKDSVSFPATAACTALKNSLLDLRAGIANGTFPVSHSLGTFCGVANTALYSISEVPTTVSKLGPILSSLYTNTPSCFGDGVIPYLVFTGSISPTSSWFYMDPEPATLTANLESTAGASAAAYYTTTGTATTAKKWGSSWTSCGTLAVGGEPCSTTALASGQQATQMINKNYSQCRCL
jgi:hypothetical protein